MPKAEVTAGIGITASDVLFPTIGMVSEVLHAGRNQ
jgi:hypothetical protein